MQRDITLYEFNSLNDNEKHEAIMDYAVNIADRIENNFNVVLYQFDNFYAELIYDSCRNKILRFRSFSSLNPLKPYLNQIDLTELKNS